MDTRNVFLAIFLSMAILFGYQYLFVPAQKAPPPATEAPTATTPGSAAKVPAAKPVLPVAVPVSAAEDQAVPAPPERPAREI